MVKIGDLSLSAVIDSFEIYIIESLIKKFETNFIMSKALFGAALITKKNKLNTIIIIKGSTRSRA